MTNRNPGQLRIGKSGPMVIGGNFLKSSIEEHEHSPTKKFEDQEQNIIRSICIIEKFDLIVKENKISGNNWYDGLEGVGLEIDCLQYMTEEDARKNLIESSIIEKESRLVIASIIRNEERNGNLKKFLNCCQDLEQSHNNIVYIFIEGDSSDNTYGILRNWLTPKKDYILKKVNRNHRPFAKDRNTRRTIYFAELRNMLIDLALSVPDLSEIFMIDANYGWKDDLISSLKNVDADIVAPLVLMKNHMKNRNEKYLFYDTWAFRRKGRQFSQFYPYTKSLHSQPLDMDSVGGGYLIKKKVLDDGVRYNGDRDCEHVGFCQIAIYKGFNIKINPNVSIIKGGYDE